MSSPAECRILVFASGNGSNFQALVDALAAGNIPNARITRLIVNRGKAYATTRAEKAGIPWEYYNLISHGFQERGETDPEKLQEARNKYDAALAEKVLALDEKTERPHLIVLAGWMYIFGKHFLAPIAEKGIKVINLHPALPGKYDGTHAIDRAYADFQAGKLENNKTGIMVHYVIEAVDQGAPVLVREIECREGESLEQLEERIHSHEHSLIVEATAKIAGEIIASQQAQK
ncbi:phosphoribosylglycinamide formyltransferase [Neurospora tetrasperma FGSC 2509]|nr:phosphoribosylglycinamide formyltransferase [Neurospora tetrasperma FGSC 2509]KAK3488578.1 phosphoribosylglycinamide formyltransferase [Neurospora crassa]